MYAYIILTIIINIDTILITLKENLEKCKGRVLSDCIRRNNRTIHGQNNTGRLYYVECGTYK